MIESIWTLLVMCMATTLIGYSIIKLKLTINNLNEHNKSIGVQERFRLNPTSTVIHILLLVVVILTGVF
jgi:hypothetical protein